jgi:hypothetical protein
MWVQSKDGSLVIVTGSKWVLEKGNRSEKKSEVGMERMKEQMRGEMKEERRGTLKEQKLEFESGMLWGSELWVEMMENGMGFLRGKEKVEKKEKVLVVMMDAL